MKNLSLPLPLLLLVILITACGDDAPTGVSDANLEGVWSGRLNEVTLLGRSLTGDIDWQFTKDTFEIRFFDPPVDQAERIAGNWKFANGKVVLELKTSFPISNDIGATDSLFVSIVDNEISIKTLSGSDILLRKTQGASLPDLNGGQLLCRFRAPQVHKPSGLIFLPNRNAGRFLPVSQRARPSKPA
jgi:hypothetical protein